MKSMSKKTKIILGAAVVVVVAVVAIFFFLKSGKKIVEAQLVEMTLPGDTQNLKGFVESVTLETKGFKEFMLVKGWVFRQGTTEKNRDLFLVLKSEGSTSVFNLPDDNILRPDVSKHFELTGGVDNHGFEAYIPLKMLSDSVFRIGFLIRDASGQSFTYLKKEIANVSGNLQIRDSKATCDRLEVKLIPANSTGKYFFEQFNANGNTLSISGWGFLDGENTDSLITYIILRNEKSSATFSTETKIRKDVTDHFKDQNVNLDRCGFAATIDGREMENGHYEACIYMTKGDKAELIYTGKFFDIAK